MSRHGRILVVDDTQQWRTALGSILRAAGYEVDTASGLEEARGFLKARPYHLLVLDIRMKENDPANIEGMDFLRELGEYGLGTALEVVMLSGYGTARQMREAFTEHKVADFMAKEEFFPEEFLAVIEKIFAAKVRVNVGLDIYWQQVSGPEEAVVGLQFGGARVRAGDPLQKPAAEELVELLRRLFHKAAQLIVRPLGRGKSGTGVLWIQPFYQSGGAPAKVVKFGDFREIEVEYENFKNYVSPYVGGGRSAAIDDLRRTARFAGIIYSHLGTAGDRLESFAGFYARSGVAQIKAVIEELFGSTCGPWYANPGVLHPFDLTMHYAERMRFTSENLECAVADNLKSVNFKSAHGRRVLHFNVLPGARDFTDPISALERHHVHSTYECITHGDLHAENILVDAGGKTWLIDFQGTGPGHYLRDVAELDSVVRFQLLAAAEATLEERLELEERLCRLRSFAAVEEEAGRPGDGDAPLDKAYATALHLRRVAHRLVSRIGGDDLGEYHVALFYYALNTIRFYSLPSVQRQHALLCASLLADSLKP